MDLGRVNGCSKSRSVGVFKCKKYYFKLQLTSRILEIGNVLYLFDKSNIISDKVYLRKGCQTINMDDVVQQTQIIIE